MIIIGNLQSAFGDSKRVTTEKTCNTQIPITIMMDNDDDDDCRLFCFYRQVFNHQQKETEQAMVVLRQEEMAIKQLMEQNARDQQKVRRKQYTMSDLSKKLADINARASEMYEPAPHPHIGRYRLAQLNQIPWSVDR